MTCPILGFSFVIIDREGERGAVILWETFSKANDIRYWIWFLTKLVLFFLLVNVFFPSSNSHLVRRRFYS